MIATETHTTVSVAAATADRAAVTASTASAELVRDHQNAPMLATVDNPDRYAPATHHRNRRRRSATTEQAAAAAPSVDAATGTLAPTIHTVIAATASTVEAAHASRRCHAAR
ncbi:hypothetical protein MPHLEI_17362 [Mycolicibacterium phlei RIVM601174]|nr:hypothetical protein MPHLEI_17362 [Mycolicibacterium phlei RIVM601174]MBF4195575.1 hypothetical protein [Mycolicibacterium phlei]